MLKQEKSSDNTLKVRTILLKREKTCLGTKQKCKNIKVDKYKQIRSSRQNDKLEQWVMHWAAKDKVPGSNLGSNKQKVFSTFNCPCYTDEQFLSDSILIITQLKAENLLTKHNRSKL